MKRFLPSYFEELKKRVLEKVGITDICPSDCYRLAVDISSSTQKRISETTLKRIYGFAESRYNPSSFTLNAMADFCGFAGWSGYVSILESFQTNNVPTHSWQSVAQTAHKITRFTLETNKQKSGVPYEYTISRSGLHRHIGLFEKSGANVCLISGQAGSGKTIGLTHWVDDQLTHTSREKEHEQNIYLFINSYSLLQVAGYGYDGGRWLAQVLNMEKKEAMHDFLKSFKNKAPGHFYLIIDDLNNHFFNDKHFNLIMNQLIDMSAYFSSFKWFKFILSTRPTTWQLYKHLIEGSKALYANWYTGFSLHTTHEAINVLPFSVDEIYQLTHHITGKNSIPSETFRKQHSFVKHPLHFQYYYQLKGRAIDPATLTTADQFAIAGPYINKHVLKGSRNTEKQLLTNQLFNHAYFQDSHICINKESAYHLIKQHHTAYRELLQSGVLYEYHTESKYRNLTEIRVQSALLGAYFIAKNLLSINNYSINIRLLDMLHQSTYPENVQIVVLKWFLVFSLETGDLSFVNELILKDHPAVDENITIFICNCFSNIAAQAVEVNFKLNDQLNHSPFIEHAVLYPDLHVTYINALKQLLRFSLTDKNSIYLHSKLGLIAFLQLDDVGTSDHIDALRQLPGSSLSSLPLNPLHGLEALHHYFRYGTVNIEAIYELTRFYFHPETYMAQQHELFLTIAVYCSLLTNNPRKSIRLISAIQLGIDQSPSRIISNDFLITISLFKALEWQRLGEYNKASDYVNHMERDYTHKFNQVLQKIIRLLLSGKSADDQAFQITHLLGIAVCERITLIEVYIRQFLISSGHYSQDQSVQEHRAALKQIMKKNSYRIDAFSAWGLPFGRAESQLEEVKPVK